MQNPGKNNSSARRILDRLAEDKKKSVTALCLITVMVFMWIRVLTKKTPQGAEAAAPETNKANQKNTPQEEYQVTFVELPKVAGRNDVIGRDFFASSDWRHFVNKQGQNPDGNEEVNILETNGNTEVIRRVAGKLDLEATFKKMGGSDLAMINGQKYLTGDVISISDGANIYKCEVIEISDNVVVIKCNEQKFELSIRP